MMKEFSKHIYKFDPAIAKLVEEEVRRQETEINLIASENYTSRAVMEASGSPLTNKYAEGYPGKRYYSGCRVVDKVENLAIERCKKLFDAEHANVQPHSGSQANIAVYSAILKPGDPIMGMELAAGGHLTHGHKINFSGITYKVVQYGVTKKEELIDYEEVETIAKKHKPKLIIAGASSYSRSIDFERFSKIAKRVGAYLLADIAHIAGLVVAELHQSPVPYADFVTSTTQKTLQGPRSGFILCKKEYAEIIDRAVMPVLQSGPHMHTIAAKAVCFHLASKSKFKKYQKKILSNTRSMTEKFKSLGYRIVSGGSDNHLFVLDLRNKKITGLQAEEALSLSGINVNRNVIPYDTKSPWTTSGIRIGTPAITTRGMGIREIEKIVGLIDKVINNYKNANIVKSIHKEVIQLCKQFPIYR